MPKIKISVESVNIIEVGETIKDNDLIAIIRTKLGKKNKFLLMSPYVHDYYIEHTDIKGYTIGAKTIDSKIGDLVKYFQEAPPMNNTKAIFILFKDLPSIIAIKDNKQNKWLEMKETKNLCKSIGWDFYKPLEVKDLELLMQISLSCMETSLKVILWHGDKIYKLFTYDIGICIPLFINNTWVKRIKEANQSMVWYWLYKQSWIMELKNRTATIEPFVDKIWKTLTI